MSPADGYMPLFPLQLKRLRKQALTDLKGYLVNPCHQSGKHIIIFRHSLSKSLPTITFSVYRCITAVYRPRS
ncbi:hypothetical protein GGU45_002956 [Niabella hirudinis]